MCSFESLVEHMGLFVDSIYHVGRVIKNPANCQCYMSIHVWFIRCAYILGGPNISRCLRTYPWRGKWLDFLMKFGDTDLLTRSYPKNAILKKEKKNNLVGEIITKVSTVGDANNIIPFCISHTTSKLILFIE